MKKIIYIFLLFFVFPLCGIGNDLLLYNRDLYAYNSIKYPKNTKSFYTESTDCPLETDHIVSLKDAHERGAKHFTKQQKEVFANDSQNLAPACKSINRMKGASPPKRFYQKSIDGKGIEINWKNNNFCKYVHRYAEIKRKYSLLFANNDKVVFIRCGAYMD